ncbi:MAG: outer membrane protein assembly factor BamD [Candidatus Omnitrophota bacterium]|nr:outer membrane protein assembly factor BamD [Candidatus Omnitrophota bacterium]
MKRVLIILSFFFFLSANFAYAYWIWTPKTGRWINPKYAVKANPNEQLEFAKSLLDNKNYEKAKTEFEKLIRHFGRSKEAAEAQFFIGVCLEKLNKPYEAFKAYDKVIKKYPFSERTQEIVEKEYMIADKLFKTQRSKVLEAVAGRDYNVVEILRAVVNNAPYGKYAPIAQYKIGLFYKSIGMYPESKEEFEKVINEYPLSEWVKAAKYQIALSDAQSSLKPNYDQSSTKSALKEFEEFVKVYPEAELTTDAKKQMQDLKNIEAESNFNIAKFYEKQKKIEPAKIYYKHIIADYPNSVWASWAMEKLEALEKKK